MRNRARNIFLVTALQLVAASAWAQDPGPLEPQHGLFWGAMGFQADFGGSVNSSGIGVVNGLRAEINSNTWGERYDPALIFRIGGAYNLTNRSQLFGALSWEQAEADGTDIGLIGGRELTGDFSDYQGWGIDVGYRRFFRTFGRLKPFAALSLGFERVHDITLVLTAPTTPPLNTGEIPFYDDSWVVSWRLGTGFLADINDRFGWQFTIDLKYAGVLSDQSGIGTVGFERINDKGNRFTLPFMGGVFVKF
jgi:hypothetical protein